jgi:hypothetical protein
MVVGRGVAAAILGASALGVGAAALVAGRPDLDDFAPVATEARQAIEAVSAATLRNLEAEALAAAKLAQLRAAIRNKVDAATIQDLFENEEWWEPYRRRAVALVGPRGSFVARGAPGPGFAAEELTAKAAPDRAVAQFLAPADHPYLEAAVIFDLQDLPRWVLVLGRPLDSAIVGEWSDKAHAGLVVSNGREVLLSQSSFRPDLLVGHEAEPLVVGTSEKSVAAPLALAPGLWVWCIRPLPATHGTPRGLLLWAGSGLLAAAALALAFTRARAGRSSDVAPFRGSVPVLTGAGRPTPATTTPSSAMTAAAASSPSPSSSPAPGERMFGRYTVIGPLGEGGMCDLFVATLAGAEGFQKTLVLKCLKPDIARNRAAVDQFIDEAKLGSTLMHSKIVSVLDFGHESDGYFIAQEYVVGRNVGQIVERHVDRLREPLDLGSVFYIAHEALQGLAHAHDKTDDEGKPMNIVHRDISPGNILVNVAGEVKLIDFGIAKSENRVARTDLGNVKGNAAFMAPEQARGLPIDRRADLFSLGLVMFYALTGEPLYRGASTAEIFYAAASGPTADRFEEIRHLPPVAAQILAKALAPDPANRYATAEEFAADIADHLAPGTRVKVATLLHALFGPELRPLSGGAATTGGLRGHTTSAQRKIS